MISDEQLKSLFIEAQGKLHESTRAMQSVRAQLAANAKETRVAQLCNKELGALDATTPTYRAVGRMFMQEDLVEMTRELNTRIATREKESIGLERAAKKLERDIKEGEAGLKEILSKRK